MELLKGWISTLCTVIVILSIAHIILPNSSVKKHVKFAFSLIILSVMLSPIIDILTMNRNIDEAVLKEKVSISKEKENEKKSFYDEGAILKSIERNLEKSLKDEFYESDFEVSLVGKINFDEIKLNVEKAEVIVLDKKRVKKVDKIFVGEEKLDKKEKKDSFLEKIEKFVEKELEISNENINVSYA